MSAKSDTPPYADKMAETFRSNLHKAVEDLNLDIADPFTKLLAMAIACADSRDEWRRELAAAAIDRDNFEAKYWAMRERAEKAEAERDALREDAERYRWLRDIGDGTWEPMARRSGVLSASQIDAAIDAAIDSARKP